MTPVRIVAAALALSSLLALANVAAARPLEAGMQQQEQAARCELSAQAGPLPALHIEVCKACKLSREDISAIKQGYAVAAHAAGYRIDILATTRVHIVETGMLENGTPYAKGETEGMWFRVGDPDPGETLGSIAGRMTFKILSGTR
ncbi:MAG: hypothetical protein Q8J70_12685 [Thiobacillus sp.]|nr:hypothetical protein [Thiobacillus sp.]